MLDFEGIWFLSDVRRLKIQNIWPNYTAAGTTFGWFGGGLAGPGLVNVVDRMEFANDTANATDRCDLTVARSGVAAITNGVYGWFAGGGVPSPASFSNVIDRITLGNDTANAISRGDLSTPKHSTAAVADGTYGWVAGGLVNNVPTNTNVITRIDFNNDGVTSSDRGALINEIREFVAVSNGTNGWFGGGVLTPGTSVNIVQRMTYANDTANAVDRCDLTSARNEIGAVADGQHGWFAGGEPATDRVDRITFASDTVDASDRCNLVANYTGVAGATDGTFGWFSGGTLNGGPQDNIIQRIEFANDTANAIDRSDLTVARKSHGGLNNSFGTF